jgi:ABC-type glutathione transport system ATPase component
VSTSNHRSELLAVRGLSAAYPDRSGWLPVFGSISFSLRAGEILGLSGPSGSGKTTLALAILGLLPPGAVRKGEIWFAGRDLLRLSRRHLATCRGRRLGIVFQEPESAFNPLIPVGAQLCEVLRLHFRWSREKAVVCLKEELKRLGVDDPGRLLDGYPRQLSVGELQRVQLAGALACRPELLICDEPTASVDLNHRCMLLDMLRNVPSEFGTSIILISHDQSIIRYAADRCMTLPESCPDAGRWL